MIRYYVLFFVLLFVYLFYREYKRYKILLIKRNELIDKQIQYDALDTESDKALLEKEISALKDEIKELRNES